MADIKLTPTEKAALDLIIAKLEEDGVQPNDPQAAIITAATPAVVEATVMIAVTVAGSCLVSEGGPELQNFREKADEIKEGVTLQQLRDLRSRTVE